MINLFEVFDKQTIVLYNSFKFSDIHRKTIVIEDNGFLPEDVETPYKFFSNNTNLPIKPLFFNQVPTPRFWSIDGNNNDAAVKNLGEIKARIIYKKNYKHRVVERVEWLNELGHTQFIDYYNKYGFKYAEVLLDPKTHRRILKRYFNYKKENFMTEYFVTNDIVLNWEEKEYFFHSKIQLVNFYLKVTGLESERFLINSFSVSSAVINNLSIQNNHYLFWQGRITSEVIHHMENILSKEHSTYSVIVPGDEVYKKVVNSINENLSHRVSQSGYVYKFLKPNHYSNQVLILTNSDQIPHLEKIVQMNTHLDFHIAAITEMSQVLMKFNQYSNVALYPNSKKDNLIKLYHKCDVYLDINKGNEILDSVRAAFDHNLLILGYKTTAHNKLVTAQNNLFDINEPLDLINILKETTEDTSILNNRLALQLDKGGSVDKETFINSIVEK